MEGLILTVERKEFDTNLPLVGKPIYYVGNGVLGNELVNLDEYLLIVEMDKTTIEAVDYRKRGITLDITQVKSAAHFIVVALEPLPEVEEPEPEPEPEEEDVVAPGTEEEQPEEEPEDVVAPGTDPEPEPDPAEPEEGA